MSTESYERSALFHERGYNNLAFFAVGKHLAGLRIDNFGIEEIIKYMHPCLIGAVDTDAGPVNLGKPVDIINLNAELFCDIVPLGIAPALRADNAFFKLYLIFEPAFVDFLGKQQNI